MIDNCLGVTAILLGITGVGFLSTIVATPAVIGIEAVSSVMGFLPVVGKQGINRLSLKISLEFETFIRNKEDIRKSSKMSFEKIVDIETVANEFLCRNKIGFPTFEFKFKTTFKTVFKIMFKTMFKIMFKPVFESVFKTLIKAVLKTVFKTVFEK